MSSNIDRYNADLDALVDKGNMLLVALQTQLFPESIAEANKELGEEKVDKLLKSLPPFKDSYQSWYTEAKVLIRQLLPDRLEDFVRHYERPKARRDITVESYRIDDYLQGITVTKGLEKEKVVGPDAAYPHFEQQLAILRSVKQRFTSSLFDIRQLVQADLFDSELDAARELAKNKFTRAAGAIAGVVLERHLAQVCEAHGVKIAKKNLVISAFNDALKDAGVIDVPQWRFIQHLGDIRNLCDHNKSKEPTTDQVDDLIDGVMKITKTLF